MKEQKKLNNAEIASFCQQTALLLQAGITPLDAMNILLTDSKNESGKKVLDSIKSEISKGSKFSEALKISGVFPDYVLTTISLGEESGNIDSCMESLAEYYEKEQSISEAINNALAYPLLMILMMFIIVFVLITKVMPIFNQVFVELGSEMTGFAGSLLRLGEKIGKYSLGFVIFLFIIFAFYFWASRTKTGKRISNNFLVNFPLTRDFYNSVACQRFASGLTLCIMSGMDTYTSLDMVKELVGNKNVAEKIDSCKDYLHAGDNLAEAISKAGIFTNLFAQMVTVGAKSGNMDLVFSKIAKSYEHNTDKTIQRIISILEPTLVITLSIIVGLILLSVILPLMGIMASIG